MTTAIEWVQNPDGTRGITVNSKTGCRNHTPEGLCFGGLFPCYAYHLANGRLKERYLANSNIATMPMSKIWAEGLQYIDIHKAVADPFYPRWWPKRLEQIRKRKTPTGIFLDDMSDWMGDYWPDEWTRQELQVMRDCPQHRFYTLTKQPQNLAKWSPFPDNCWVGVTATNESAVLNATNYFFDHRIAKTQFLSIEPLLSWDTSNFVYPFKDSISRKDLDWLIIGACTGTLNGLKPLILQYPGLSILPYDKRWTLQPKPEWVQEIVEAADRAGVKVFLKDNLMPLFEAEGITKREDWTGIRQELPE